MASPGKAGSQRASLAGSEADTSVMRELRSDPDIYTTSYDIGGDNDLIGLVQGQDYLEDPIPRKESRKKYMVSRENWENVRFGTPKGPVDFEATKKERDLLIRSYYCSGWKSFPSTKLSPKFKKAVAYFRACLDIWDQFSPSKVFSKEEIYIRCLSEGPSFAEFIKKSRATCFRAFTAETDTEVEEEYFHDTYTGYNSIIHERYLIHFDDTKGVDDIKWAFTPTKEVDTERFRASVKQMFADFRVEEETFNPCIDMIGALKNVKMYDPVQKKSLLMREFWDSSVEASGPYFAKRSVVPIEPGNCRDTGVGDARTILKIKQLNQLCRTISEKVPYCANAPGKIANSRLKRILKKNAFLHLDFKKYGLTFPRALTNVLIEEIGVVSGLDTSHLIIDSFYVEIDGETYETARGAMLGWLDCVNYLAVAAILHNLVNEGLQFDFIGFNDDVEISKRVSDHSFAQTLEILRSVICIELDSYDIPISINKTYGSRASVFLERYAYYSQYGIDMYKEQLTVKAYAISLVTTHIWEAKMQFAAAEQWTKSDYCRDRCIDTCPIEFRREEINLPLWAGGWYLRVFNGLDYSMALSDRLGIRLGFELSKWKPLNYSTKMQPASTGQKIADTIEDKCFNSHSKELGDLVFRDKTDIVNEEISYLVSYAQTLCDTYQGRKQQFATLSLSIIERCLERTRPPDG